MIAEIEGSGIGSAVTLSVGVMVDDSQEGPPLGGPPIPLRGVSHLPDPVVMPALTGRPSLAPTHKMDCLRDEALTTTQ